jgi:hypothetical protein
MFKEHDLTACSYRASCSADNHFVDINTFALLKILVEMTGMIDRVIHAIKQVVMNAVTVQKIMGKAYSIPSKGGHVDNQQ